jgi:hypothetical protein
MIEKGEFITKGKKQQQAENRRHLGKQFWSQQFHQVGQFCRMKVEKMAKTIETKMRQHVVFENCFMERQSRLKMLKLSLNFALLEIRKRR